jgi:hypothetical protein
VAESLWETGFYLPSSSGLSEATIEQIAGTIVRIRDEAVAVAQRS